MHLPLTPLSVSSLAASLSGSVGDEGGRRPLIAGVLSGTSADGIDVVLACPTFEAQVGGEARLVRMETVAFATEPFEAALGQRVRRVLDGHPISLGDLAALDRDLGRAFGAAARQVADRHDMGELVLVASHGQTVFHHDGDASLGKVTLQLGDGDFVAEAAGVPVVSDFRVRDCAAGGEGAPLVGLVDDVLLADAPRPLAILNLGGISNWTILGGNGAEPIAFDAGPAGSLLDSLSRRLLDSPCDLGGSRAAEGTPSEEIVRTWLAHPFFEGSGPRSTGRDTFGEAYVEVILAELEVDPGALSGGDQANLLSTACLFVARAAARGLASALVGRPSVLHVYVAGGGIHNAALMGSLEREVRQEIATLGVEMATFDTSAAAGVSPDGREALAFAALGARFMVGEPSTSPAATGAQTGRILGKWSPGSTDLHLVRV